MYAIRVYRRPKKDAPVLEMILCKGCVTPKLCRKSGDCDVEEKNNNDTEKEKIIKVKSSADKPKSIRKNKS